MKPTAKTEIMRVLQEAGKPLGVHEFKDYGLTCYSENNLATRLPELAKAGLVTGNFRPGTNYKEWAQVPAQRDLPLCP